MCTFRIPSIRDGRTHRRSGSILPLIATLHREEAGSELVEFSFTISVVLTTIFAILASSLALYAQHFVATAARDATRYAIVRGSYWNGASCTTTTTGDCTATAANVTSFVQSTVPPLISSSQLNISTKWLGNTANGTPCDSVDGANSQTCLVTVTVSYNYNFLLPFLPSNTITLSSTASGTITE